MGKITDENRRKIEEADSFDDIVLDGMLDNVFSEELDKLIVEKNVSVQHIVNESGLSKSYINKLRNPLEKKAKPKRNAIINIALALDATLEETNLLLKYAQYQELYTRNDTEALIIWGMLKKKTGAEIRMLLYDRGMDDLYKQ